MHHLLAYGADLPIIFIFVKNGEADGHIAWGFVVSEKILRSGTVSFIAIYWY